MGLTAEGKHRPPCQHRGNIDHYVSAVNGRSLIAQSSGWNYKVLSDILSQIIFFS